MNSPLTSERLSQNTEEKTMKETIQDLRDAVEFAVAFKFDQEKAKKALALLNALTLTEIEERKLAAAVRHLKRNVDDDCYVSFDDAYDKNRPETHGRPTDPIERVWPEVTY